MNLPQFLSVGYLQKNSPTYFEEKSDHEVWADHYVVTRLAGGMLWEKELFYYYYCMDRRKTYHYVLVNDETTICSVSFKKEKQVVIESVNNDPSNASNVIFFDGKRYNQLADYFFSWFLGRMKAEKCREVTIEEKIIKFRANKLLKENGFVEDKDSPDIYKKVL